MNTYDQKILLWPSVCFVFKWKDYHEHKDNLINFCYKLKEENNESDIARMVKNNLFESTFDFLEKPVQPVQQLKSFINEKIWEVLQEMNGDRMKENDTVHVNYESWMHITNDNGYHDYHVHPMCSWCGIFYAQPADTKEGNGVNRFYNPYNNLYSDYGSLYQTSLYAYQPEEGDLFIFPSHIGHNATPYKGDKDRIVIAFNAQVEKLND